MSGSPLQWIQSFFGSFRFPVFTLTLVGGYEAMLLTLLLLPGGESQTASFADEFRVWCFGYDPATGSVEWASVFTTFTSPMVLMAVVVGVWFDPLVEIWKRRRRAMVPYVLAAAAVVVSSSLYLTSLKLDSYRGELPFPAQVLRTRNVPPELILTNQDGQRVDLADYRGKVVILTAVYASCGFTCPMIMGQAKRVVAGLSDAQRQDLAFIAVTLDPKSDTPEVLARMAEGQEIAAPLFNLCTGESTKVEGILDDLEISRTRDPETGVIDHANMFLLVDRNGYIAFRLTLGDRQERWLASAIRLLLRERVTE